MAVRRATGGAGPGGSVPPRPVPTWPGPGPLRAGPDHGRAGLRVSEEGVALEGPVLAPAD